ncbi:NACHT domain-containing protein [Nocardia sp. NPDC127579]|uniref:NACHT domain-containing protein n=1 Tax=Nocardia sp. NPDC127579 TaxID=3345402 RepID=UPI00363D4DF4
MSATGSMLGVVADFAGEEILHRIQRIAAERTIGTPVAYVAPPRRSADDLVGTWSDSILAKLPRAMSPELMCRFARTPEFIALTRMLIAVDIVAEGTAPKRRIMSSVGAALEDFYRGLPGVNRPGSSSVAWQSNPEIFTPVFGQAFFTQMDEQCARAADNIKHRTRSTQDAHRWAFSIVATDIMNSISTSLEYLTRDVARRTSLDWVDRYRMLFTANHREITSPDLHVRRTVDYTDLFVGPTVFRLDTKSMRPHTGRQPDLNADTFTRFYTAIDRSVLVGDPGGGKSTSSTVAALELAREYNLVPFIVVLRELEEPEFHLPTLLSNLLHRRYEIEASAESIMKLLHEDSALIVFDGLDEVFNNADRAHLAKKIESIAKAYQFLKILVTCRKIGYATAALNPQLFTAYEIGSFSERRIETYVKQWFSVQPDVRSDEVVHAVRDFMEQSTGMRDLTENPLLLAFMCVLYRGLGTIPEDRASLYEKCIELLLSERDRHFRIVVDIPNVATTKTALARLAHFELDRETITGFTEQAIVDELVPFLAERTFASRQQAEEFVHAMLARCRGRAWIFTDIGLDRNDRDLFTFTHASFREYFGALYFVRTHQSVHAVVDHLYPLVTAGKSEIYAQVCCALFEERSLAGASDVIAAMVDKLRGDFPASRHSTYSDMRGRSADESRRMTKRRVGAAYLAGIANCVPLSTAAMRSLLRFALEQLTFDDSAAVARLLDPVSKHHQAIIELLAEDFTKNIVELPAEPTTRRQLWFAIHARYLLAAPGPAVIKPRAVVAINQVTLAVGPYLRKFAGNLDIEYVMLLQSGHADLDQFTGLSEVRFDKVFVFLFEQYVSPLSTLGPTSMAEWIFDSFASHRRSVMPVARVAMFLRCFEAGLREQLKSLGAHSIPDHPAVAVDHFDYFPLLKRVAGYAVECRTALLFLVAARVELNEKLVPSVPVTPRATVAEWARDLRVAPDLAAWLDLWAQDRKDLWSPPPQVAE